MGQVVETSPEATGKVVVLPCPRLELRWEKKGRSWLERECVYSLVIPLSELDIRSTDVEGLPRRELVLEIGRTQVTGGCEGPPITDGEVNTPFRDGAHAQWDCEALGGHLPIVAVCGDVVTLVPKKTRVSEAGCTFDSRSSVMGTSG